MPLEHLGTSAFISETQDFQCDPDGALNAVGQVQAAAWSDMISRIIDLAIAGVEQDARTQQPDNRFNVGEGLVHLTQRANTLGAEIVLGASASVLRHDPAGQPVQEATRLICCSGFGELNRSSD